MHDFDLLGLFVHRLEPKQSGFNALDRLEPLPFGKFLEVRVALVDVPEVKFSEARIVGQNVNAGIGHCCLPKKWPFLFILNFELNV